MKIVGNTVGTTTPKPDWDENDPKKGAYIKNKLKVDSTLTKEGQAADANATGKRIDAAVDTAALAASAAETAASTAETAVSTAASAVSAAETAKLYFPPLEKEGAVGNHGSSAIMMIGDKCVIFDCGAKESKDAIINYYNGLDFSKISTVIIVISHYHYDHVENLDAILGMSVFSGKTRKVYLPMNPNGYVKTGDSSLTQYTNVDTVLKNRGITPIVVSADTTVKLLGDFCTMELFNSTSDDYNHYKNKTADYNNYSMCALIRTGDVYSMFPGDIFIEAQERIASRKKLPRLVVYPIHHHGYEKNDCLAYMNMIRPEYGILSLNHARFVGHKDDGISFDVDGLMANYATEHIYSTAYGECEFVVGKDGGSVVRGREIVQCGWKSNSIELYVDNTNSDLKCDGSKNHPFTNVTECLSFINTSRQTDFTINIKKTSTPYPFLYLRNISKRIVLKGSADAKPIIEGVYVYNSDLVEFENLSFTAEGVEDGRMVYVVASNLIMDACEINPAPESKGLTYKAIECHKNAYVCMSDCVISNALYGVYSTGHSTACVDGNEFDNVTNCYRLANLDLRISGADDELADNVATYISGNQSSGLGTQYHIATRPEGSRIKELVAKNGSTIVSHPFYFNGNLCIAYGTNVYTIATGERAVKNLLDNSYFANPVNHRGLKKYTDSSYKSKHTIDRWKTYGHVSVDEGYITLENVSPESKPEANNLYQYFQPGTIVPGKIYTAACMLSSGTIYVGSGFAEDGANGKKIFTSSNGELGLQIAANLNGLDHFAIRNEIREVKKKIVWAALYEGEFTKENLPKYQPKGYGTELAECQRYLQRFRTADLRKTYCDDFRPTMRMTDTGEVSTFEQEIDGVTYYFASAEL